MAIDTAAKRKSCIGLALLFLRPGIIPDGSNLAAAERLHTQGLYSGIAASSPPGTGGALASLCDWDWGNNMSIDTYHNVITGALEAIGSTALQLSASTRKLYKGVTIVANSSNAQTVWLGTSTVTPGTVAATDGLPLTAGQSVALPVDMLSRVYVVAASGSNKVHFLAS